MSDVERIAAGLSESQINLLFFWPKELFDERTRLSLQRKKLIYGEAVTPLGKAVKAHLEAISDD